MNSGSVLSKVSRVVMGSANRRPSWSGQGSEPNLLKMEPRKDPNVSSRKYANYGIYIHRETSSSVAKSPNFNSANENKIKHTF